MAATKTPFEEWIAAKIASGETGLTPQRLASYQLAKLRETIGRAQALSPFYRERFKNMAETTLGSLNDLSRFPFTDAGDIAQNPLGFLCVSQAEISRVVTLQTSGTSGRSKRLYFTPSDQELTIDFFRQGMSDLATAGDRVLILLPGERPGSVGDLLATALRRAGVSPVPYGIIGNIPDTLDAIDSNAINVIVGIPAQVLALARYGRLTGRKSLSIKSILLSTDYVPRVISSELKRLWGCEVFEHYGMTEMGLGGGVDCQSHEGYHLREADLYFEIIDPGTLLPVPDGQMGEVVFTTLTRSGMPLIRYRTGDMARFLPQRCGCGTILRRLGRIAHRKSGQIFLKSGDSFTLPELDEALFGVSSLLTYSAQVDNRIRAEELRISAVATGVSHCAVESGILNALASVPAVFSAVCGGKLKVAVSVAADDKDIFAGTAKRIIAELNGTDGSENSDINQTREN